MGTQLNIDMDAVKKCHKGLQISVGVCLPIAGFFLLFSFPLILAALEDSAYLYEAALLTLVAVVWTFVAQAQIRKLRRLMPLVHAVEDGQVTIPDIARRCRLEENNAEKHLAYMIKKGIFPGAVIERDMLVIPGAPNLQLLPPLAHKERQTSKVDPPAENKGR